MSIQHQWSDSAVPAPATLTSGMRRERIFVPAAANDSEALPPLQAVAKRALDLIVAVPLLILLLPLLAAIAVAIRIDSRGSWLFRQTRLGAGGKPFAIYKFRTMTVAENGDRVVQARPNDPRVTRLGRFLRKSSLDELPQLLNVIEGSMSLVGPRPHARAHDDYYAGVIAHYTQRQRVKPGITGWAQVNGKRGETPTIDAMRERVDLDLWYVAHASVLLDLTILWRTAAVLARSGNAY